MRKFLLKLALLFGALVAPQIASAGVCPTGATYWKADGSGQTTLSAAKGVTNCFYASTAIGSDSAFDGTQETISGSHGPWAHIPGMNGCASNCLTVTPTAGMGFILRGGDTWNTADLNYVYHGSYGSGTVTNNVYIGVDQSWFSGVTFTRPIWQCLNAACSALAGGSFYAVLGNTSSQYIVMDNIEMTGLHEASVTGGYVQMGGPHQTVEDMYFHGWEHTGASTDPATAISDSSTDGTFRYSVCDGIDTTQDMMQCSHGGDMRHIYGNIMQYVTDGINSQANTFIHHNRIGPIICSFQGCGHSNGLLNGGPSAGDSAMFAYDNVMVGIPLGGQGHYWFNQSSVVPFTGYIFNNVQYATASGNNVNTCQLPAGQPNSCGSWRFFNNTFEGGGVNFAGGVSGPVANTAQITQTTTQTWENNHCFTSCTNGSGANAGGSVACQNTTSPFTCNATVTETDTLPQTIAQADANTSPHFDQYTETQTFPFSPVAATNSTVLAGINEQSLCATIAALDAAAGAACQSDTGFACSYNTSNHTSVCPARPPVLRPVNGPWDIGAYQFVTGLTPPTNLKVTPEVQTLLYWGLSPYGI